MIILVFGVGNVGHIDHIATSLSILRPRCIYFQHAMIDVNMTVVLLARRVALQMVGNIQS